MKTIPTWSLTVTLCGCLLATGCDMKPGPIRHKWQAVKVLAVDVQDPAEVEAVTAYKTAETNYGYRLSVLQAYYEHTGMIDKHEASTKELKNLQDARWFDFVGGPEVVPPEGEPVAGRDEKALVEQMVASRQEYKEALSELHQFYERKGEAEKTAMVRRVAERYDFIETYDYFPEAEVPGEGLRPTKVIPEADAMFDEALRLHRSGKPLPLITDYKKQRRALRMFIDLVNRYPTSTKIALSAYYIGDIYKEYFREDLRAVRWYERAWQWDPAIPKPARFQAAVVYDLRLFEREKALELYRQVVEHEQFNQSNVSFAYDRIAALSKAK